MCVAEELQKPATEIYDLMMQNRVLQDYIVEFYDVLHTQSREYIVEDIINLMKENQILWLFITVHIAGWRGRNSLSPGKLDLVMASI